MPLGIAGGANTMFAQLPQKRNTMLRNKGQQASRRQKEAKNHFWSVQTYYLTVEPQSILQSTVGKKRLAAPSPSGAGG